MVKPIVVEVTQPAPWVSINQRDHWSKRNANIQAWRQAAALYARIKRAKPVTGAFTIHAAIHKTSHQLWDADGITPTVKACIDGLRDAGLIPNDDHRVMRSFTVSDGGPREHGAVVLTIAPMSVGHRSDTTTTTTER